MRHETIEKSMNLMIVLIILAISIGGLVEIIPLMMSADTTEPVDAQTRPSRSASTSVTACR